MRTLARLVFVGGVLTVAGLDLVPLQAAEQRQATDRKQTTTQTPGQKQVQEQWRYTFHNGEWWYWLPANRWVYWRSDRWNDYDPKTYVSPRSAGVVAAAESRWVYGNRAASEADSRPFYGRAVSEWDRRGTEANSDIGPFYGRAMPSEVFGGWRARRSSRPYYGHAVLAYGD
jgi:hypothetical protein